jgi:hypothetical protein
MNLHSGARTCPASRALLVERIERERWCVTAAARAAGVSRRTAHKWIARHACEGAAGLLDRSSRPGSSPTALSVEEVGCVLYLRHTRMTVARIATSLDLPRSSVARILQRHGLSRLKSLEPGEPARRYTRRHPGELVHLDVKKLGRITGFYGHRITGNRRRRRRGAGWDFVHVAIDDASRLAYAEVLPNEQGDTSAGFMARALVWFARLGIRVRQIMTDNGSGYVSACFGAACEAATSAPAHSPLSALHQWQSGALHPDPDPRMGLRAALSHLRPASSRSAAVPFLLQPRTATR